MKINLGSGWRKFKGYLSVDLYDESAEIKADLRTVEFDSGSIEEVLCYHTIEHVVKDDGVRLVQRVYNWLVPGGRFVVETPDYSKCLDLMRRGVKHKDGAGIVRLIGAVGMLGGRPGTREGKAAYHAWIWEHKIPLCQLAEEFHYVPLEAIPDEYKEPGLHHLYVWDAAELQGVMEAVGFTVSSVKPQTHGARDWRDMRLEAVK